MASLFLQLLLKKKLVFNFKKFLSFGLLTARWCRMQRSGEPAMPSLLSNFGLNLEVHSNLLAGR